MIERRVLKFRKDINGLRAIAVIAVVLFHFQGSSMPGGFAGVDVFFVISGFLMTGIIFSGIEQEKFSIVRFYVARANRIIPALAALCLVLLVFGWFYLTPPEYKSMGKHIFSSIGFFSNIIYWKESGYFEIASRENWLLHTWSLSVEWQFYILYPLTLVALQKFLTVKTMKTAVLFGTVLSFIFCVIATYKWPNPAYYLLPTRAWEMMLGGVAYLYPVALQERRKRLIEYLGLALIGGSYFLVSKESPWPGYLALFPVLGSFLVILAQRNESMITGNIILQKLGAWSYSIYLWHWPLVIAIYSFSLSEIYAYLGISLSIVLGFLSNKYIERIRFRSDFGNSLAYLGHKPLYLVLIAGLLGGYVFSENGINDPIRSISTTEEAKYLSKFYSESYKKDITAAYSQECNFFDLKTHAAKAYGIPETCTNNGKGGIFIWGDSHAQALSYGIRVAFPGTNINQVASSTCRPLIKEDTKTRGAYKHACDKSNEKAKREILKIIPKVIILAQRLDHDLNDYFEILQYIKKHNLGSKIILVGPVPQWQPSLPKTIARRHFNINDKVISDFSFVSALLPINSRLHSNYDNSEIEFISIIDLLCDKQTCLAKVDRKNTPLVWDYGHLSPEGSIYVAENLLKNTIASYL